MLNQPDITAKAKTEYLEDMFGKVAAISFRSHLAEMGLESLLCFDFPMSKLAAISPQETTWPITSFGEPVLRNLRGTDAVGDTLAAGSKSIWAKLRHGTVTDPNMVAKGYKATAARGLNRVGAARDIADIGSNLVRSRGEGEGFFESAGRRAGNIGSTVISAASGGGKVQKAVQALGLAGMAGSIAGVNIPQVGDIAATAGKAVDKTLGAAVGTAKAVGTGARKLFGGGQDYDTTKAQAMAPKPPSLKQPPAKRLEGDQFRMGDTFKS